MKIDILWWCFLLPLCCWGQINEDFSDGDMVNNHRWIGNIESFTVSDGKLRLNENQGGNAFLSTANQASTQASWEFDLEMDFNPSSNNFCRIYLVSDLPELNNALKGYYVQVGSSLDDIGLYRQDIFEHVALIKSVTDIVDTSKVKISIRVTREVNTWSLYFKFKNQDRFELIGEFEDDRHFDSNYFGFYCQYTISRSKGFFFDNIVVEGESFPDKEPPQLSSIKLVAPQSLIISLNEPLQPVKIDQFFVPSIGVPSELIKTAYAEFQLTFQKPFVSGVTYLLKGFNLLDLAGNSALFSMEFTYWEVQSAELHDVVITEIMADPSPVLQLPDKEYLELHNRSDKAVNLSGWRLSDQTSQVELPDYLMSPGSYVVLCPKSNNSRQPDSLKTISLTSWPTLNNQGDLVTIADSTGKSIHYVNYLEHWYRSNIKNQGGWSMEMIDINYPCSGSENWTASTSSLGGTPGWPNSVSTDNPDLSAPEVTSTFAASNKELQITFDQVLSTENKNQWEVMVLPNIRVDTFFVKFPQTPVLTIQLIDSLLEGVIYHISTSGIADCNQNVSIDPGPGVLVGLAKPPDSLDLVINEILFNPRPLGVPFVELYNKSNKALNLKNWRFAKRQSSVLTDFNTVTSQNLMIYPEEYLAFTRSPEKLRNQYPDFTNSNIVRVDDLPALSDDQGSLVVLEPRGSIIDELGYDEDMHHSLLTDRNGVSLERVSADLPSNDHNNWHSASESSGYATPGMPNSQANTAALATTLSVVPNIISGPTGAYPSYANILYQLEQPGSSGSVDIYNSQGYKVRTLINNSILSINGSFKWDGTDDHSKLVPFGYYIVLFQVKNSQGLSRQIKQTVVVAPNY